MLEQLSADLWIARDEIRIFGGVRLPTCMTVVRLPNADLWLHSPVRAGKTLVASVARLGPVAHVVAPSLLHHTQVAPWLGRLPGARLYGAPGLPKKRRDLRFDETLTDEAPPAWRTVIEQLVIKGMPHLNETVFFHRPSRTLIVSDLVFNIKEPANFFTGLVLRSAGTHKRLAQSRIWKRHTKDEAAMRQSLARLQAWDFERVIMGHGEPLLSAARPAFDKALAP